MSFYRRFKVINAASFRLTASKSLAVTIATRAVPSLAALLAALATRAVLSLAALLAALAACAPMHIKEHQAHEKLNGPYLFAGENKCGQGATSYTITHPNIIWAEVNVRSTEDEKNLELTLTVEAKDNTQISVPRDPVKVKFSDGKTYTVIPTLISAHHRQSITDNYNSSPTYATPTVERLSLDEAYIFKVQEGYAKNIVEMRASFPFQPDAFEVELPDVEIDWDSIGPLVLKYDYVNKWGLYRVVGCD